MDIGKWRPLRRTTPHSATLEASLREGSRRPWTPGPEPADSGPVKRLALNGGRAVKQLVLGGGRILGRAGRRLTFNNGHVWAAAIAYYGLVSLFPLVLLLLSVSGFVFPVTTLADKLVAYSAELLPGSEEFFRQSLRELVLHRGSMGLAALLTLYWSASGAFTSLSRALDLVWDTPVTFDQTTAFLGPARVPPSVGVWRRVRAMGIVLGLGLLFLVSVLATTYLRLAERIQDLPRLGPFGPNTGMALLGLVPILVTVLVFLGLYALIPRRPPPWRALWPGALVAASLFELAKSSFAWYATRLRSHAWAYGSVTTTIILLIWLYVVSVIVIYGAEVGAIVRARAWGPPTAPRSMTAVGLGE